MKKISSRLRPALVLDPGGVCWLLTGIRLPRRGNSCPNRTGRRRDGERRRAGGRPTTEAGGRGTLATAQNRVQSPTNHGSDHCTRLHRQNKVGTGTSRSIQISQQLRGIGLDLSMFGSAHYLTCCIIAGKASVNTWHTWRIPKARKEFDLLSSDAWFPTCRFN